VRKDLGIFGGTCEGESHLGYAPNTCSGVGAVGVSQIVSRETRTYVYNSTFTVCTECTVLSSI